MTERYTREDGLIAVLYSPGYGAGWSTWCWEFAKEITFDPEIVKLVLNKNDETVKLISEYCGRKYGEHAVYCGGADSLEIYWAQPGESFQIDEYDGFESVSSRDFEDWLSA